MTWSNDKNENSISLNGFEFESNPLKLLNWISSCFTVENNN